MLSSIGWAGLEGGKPILVGQPGMENLDVVLPRQGTTLGNACLLLIHHFSMMGILLVNNLNSIRSDKKQFFCFANPVRSPYSGARHCAGELS